MSEATAASEGSGCSDLALSAESTSSGLSLPYSSAFSTSSNPIHNESVPSSLTNNTDSNLRGSKANENAANHQRSLQRKPSKQRSFSVSSEAPLLDNDLIIPQSEWLPKIMRSHPEVLELREKFRNVLGLSTFASLPSSSLSSTEIKETIDPDIILALIDRYLKDQGFENARAMLQSESQVFTATNESILKESFEEGDLEGLIRLGITPTVFANPDTNDPDPEIEALIEGISISEQDVNIWSEYSNVSASSASLQASFLSSSAENQFSPVSGHKNLILERIHHHSPSNMPSRTLSASTGSLSASSLTNLKESSSTASIRPANNPKSSQHVHQTDDKSENDAATNILAGIITSDSSPNLLASSTTTPPATILEDESIEVNHHTVKGATFNQLVLWLLSNFSDSKFRHVFFATLYGFTTPQQFIMKLEQRYHSPPNLPKLDHVEICSIANVLTYWISSHGHEFSSRIFAQLSKFIETSFIKDGHTAIAESLQNILAKFSAIRLSRKRLHFNPTTTNVTAAMSSFANNSHQVASLLSPPLSGGASIAGTNSGSSNISSSSLNANHSSTSRFFSAVSHSSCPEPKVPKNIFEPTLQLDDVDEEEIARQLTCLDYDTYSRIKTQELLKNQWMKNKGKKSKRVVRLLNTMNATTKWIIDSFPFNANNSIPENASSSNQTNIYQAAGNTANLSNTNSPLKIGNSNSSNNNNNSNSTSSKNNKSSNTSDSQASSTMSAFASFLSGQPKNSSNNAATIPPTASSSSSLSSTSISLMPSNSSSSISSSSTISGNSPFSAQSPSELPQQIIITQNALKKFMKVLLRWLKIAEHLKALNNFHSLMAVYTALSSKSIHPIIETYRKDIPKSSLEILTWMFDLYDHSDSFVKYRKTLQNVSQSLLPCIPALPIHLRDIALIEEVYPDFLRTNRQLINFQKRRVLYIAIRDLLRPQLCKFNLLVVYQISDRIQLAQTSHFNLLQTEKQLGQFDYAA